MVRVIPSLSTRSPLSIVLLAGLVGIAVGVLVPTTGQTARILAITTFCIVLWILNPIEPAYTGIIGIGLISVTFPLELAFTGFQSPATWLVGFGLLMGEATRQSGLAEMGGRRITDWSISSRSRSDPRRTYRRLLVSLGLGAFALALLIPSSLVRVLLLAPILKGVGERFDSRQAKVGLFLGPLFATFYGSVGILTADLPNIIITGISASVTGHQIPWSEWFISMFPIMGLLRALLVLGIIAVLYQPPSSATFDDTGSAEAPTDGSHRRMFVFLCAGTIVWMTDFIHGFHPVVGALLVVSLAFLPSVGTTSLKKVSNDVDYLIIFFLAAVLAIGETLTYTGFNEQAATYLLGLGPEEVSVSVSLFFVFLSTMLLTLLMEGLAVASVLTPVLIQYAEALGLPLSAVLMTEAMALNTYFFPYQSAVLIAILTQDVVDSAELIRTTVICSVATVVVLLPLQFAYFTLLY